MADRHPDYRVEKRGGKAGARKSITFSKRSDEQRCGWIVIAGEDSDFLQATVCWTVQGDSLDDLDYEYAEDASAARGWLHLTDEQLVDDDLPPDGDRLLGLGDPPLALQQAAIAAWRTTDIFTRERQLLVQQVRKKNPAVTDEEIEAEQQRCNRATFQGWLAIEMALKLDEEQLRQVADVLLNKIFYLLDKYALPFLKTKVQ